MKTYQKPTIMLSSTASTASTLGSCMEKVDAELIQQITGLPITNDSFGMNEACKKPVPIEFYCKFTSGELGALQAFIS